MALEESLSPGPTGLLGNVIDITNHRGKFYHLITYVRLVCVRLVCVRLACVRLACVRLACVRLVC